MEKKKTTTTKKTETTKKSLGKGLDEIFGGDVNNLIENITEKRTDGNVIEIKISELVPNPYQPRKQFDIDELQGLADSIKQNGLFTPVLVKKNEANKYYIVAGERRTKASALAGLKTVRAIVANITDDEMQRITLVENVQREDLNPIEIAISLNEMMEKQKLTQDKLAKVVGKSRSYVANLLGLLKLNKKIIDAVLSGEISYGHARPLINLSEEDSLKILRQIITQDLNVRETEGYAKASKLREARANKEPVKAKPRAQEIIYAEELVRNKVKSKVEITDSKIIIKYKGKEQLKRILERMEAIEK